MTVKTDIRRSNKAASAQTITATINLLEKRKAFSVEVSRFRTLFKKKVCTGLDLPLKSCNDGRDRECHVLVEGGKDMRQADPGVTVLPTDEGILRINLGK